VLQTSGFELPLLRKLQHASLVPYHQLGAPVPSSCCLPPWLQACVNELIDQLLAAEAGHTKQRSSVLVPVVVTVAAGGRGTR
jgi:hypothetical protein